MRASAQLLVLSPDSTLRRAAQRCASSIGHATLLATTVDEAQQIMARVRVDLICLDSVLSDEERERFCRWLDSDGSHAAPAVVLFAPRSAQLAPSAVPPFLRKESVGLVGKPLDSSELAAEIARLLSARPRSEPDRKLLRMGSIALDARTRELLLAAGGSVPLTPIEFRLLRCLMERQGEFVSPDELLEAVWGYPPGTGGPELVRAHVSNVRRKLRLLGEDPQLVRSVPYRGYGFVPGDGTPS
ncbi:MAG: response regulator transcription factor [Dehalococcoidia bacterium]